MTVTSRPATTCGTTVAVASAFRWIAQASQVALRYQVLRAMTVTRGPVMMSGAPDAFALTPAWLNIFENPAAVQFVHRWLGILTALVGLALWARAVRANAAHRGIHAAALIVLCQAALGIATLLTQVCLPLAALHQAGAVVLLTAVIYCLRRENFSL